MEFLPVHTRTLTLPQDNLLEALLESGMKLQDGDILSLSSKVVAIDQGDTVPIADVPNKKDLLAQEAEKILELPGTDRPWPLTLKYNTLNTYAGIDESNGDGHYILWPKAPVAAAKLYWDKLREHFGIENLGIIILDSSFIPLRNGTSGISIGFYGFHPTKNYKGTPDLFGRALEYTELNIVDSVAAAANMVMGEGNESIPAVITRHCSHVKFTDQDTNHELPFPMEQDVFAPLFAPFIDNE